MVVLQMRTAHLRMISRNALMKYYSSIVHDEQKTTAMHSWQKNTSDLKKRTSDRVSLWRICTVLQRHRGWPASEPYATKNCQIHPPSPLRREVNVDSLWAATYPLCRRYPHRNRGERSAEPWRTLSKVRGAHLARKCEAPYNHSTQKWIYAKKILHFSPHIPKNRGDFAITLQITDD